MGYDIARIYDFHPTVQEPGVTVAGLLAASGGIKVLAVEAATAIPVLGWWLIKPGIAVAVCKGVGKLIIEHYEQKYKEAQSTVA